MVKRKLNIAIIDDEQHAIETLVYDLHEAFQQQIEILFTATNPFEGARQVRTHKPDILFLDILMPGLSGFDLIRLIDDLDTKVVFTTAYLELQQQNKNSRVLECLLKPVLLTDIERIFNRIYNLQSK
jgi:two-component system, LytTR family, response regulator